MPATHQLPLFDDHVTPQPTMMEDPEERLVKLLEEVRTVREMSHQINEGVRQAMNNVEMCMIGGK